MAYGTPGSPEEIEPYYTDIRRGNPPPPELLADLVRRYEAIGGTSPLAERTRAQAAGLAAALDERGAGEVGVTIGLKHATPKIEDAVDELVDSGVGRIVGLVLAPHFSAASVGQYLERARRRAAERDPAVEVLGIESWHLEPAYVDFLTGGVRAGLAGLPERTKVLFTAHSLPVRAVAGGDPYPDQLRETAEAVAGRVGLVPWSTWAVAWQSAGRTPDPWLGPDVLSVLRDLAATGRADGALVCPCGFVADHLEVLYDLDIEARQVAAEAGLAFGRTPVLNDDPTVLGALADRVLGALER
jgi:ferrochelatase